MEDITRRPTRKVDANRIRQFVTLSEELVAATDAYRTDKSADAEARLVVAATMLSRVQP